MILYNINSSIYALPHFHLLSYCQNGTLWDASTTIWSQSWNTTLILLVYRNKIGHNIIIRLMESVLQITLLTLLIERLLGLSYFSSFSAPSFVLTKNSNLIKYKCIYSVWIEEKLIAYKIVNCMMLFIYHLQQE